MARVGEDRLVVVVVVVGRHLPTPDQNRDPSTPCFARYHAPGTTITTTIMMIIMRIIIGREQKSGG